MNAMQAELIQSPIPFIIMLAYIAVVIWMAWYHRILAKQEQTSGRYLNL